MTVGSPWKNLLIFAIPMLIGNLTQQMYSLFDGIIVGRYEGYVAFGAIGATMPIVFLMLSLFIGISSGAGIMVSQYFGAKRREDLSHTIGTCLTLTVVTAIVLSIILPLFTRPLLNLINVPYAMIEYSVIYLNITLWGCIGLASYNILAGILRGLGDSFTPFIYLFIATILSIALNVLFIGVFGWGVAGAAISSVVCQLLSGVLCFLRLRKMTDVFDLRLKNYIPKKQYVKQVTRLGLPTGISNGVFSVAMLMVMSLINDFGPALIASNTAVMKVDGFVIMPMFAFAAAITAYTGQNIGAGKLARVKPGMLQCLVMSIGLSIAVTIVIIIFGRDLASLFTDEAHILDMASQILRLLAPGYVALAFGQIFWGVLRGAGDVMTPMWAIFFTTVVVRVPAAYLFAFLMERAGHDYPYLGIFYGSMLAWVLGAVIAVGVYRFGKWREKGIVRDA